MSFFAVLFVAGVVILIIWAIRSSSGSGGDRTESKPMHGQRDTAMDEVRRRYAAGEITREEYEQLERDLRR